MNIRKFGAVLLAMSAGAMPGPALAQYYPGEGPIYYTYYFDDAQHSQVVGIYYGDCLYTGPVYHSYLEGQTSPHSEDVYAGYCREGIWEPI